LAKRPDGDTGARVTGYVAYVDVVAARLDGYAVIATLVDEVRELYIADVHRVFTVRLDTAQIPSWGVHTETIGVLYPIPAMWCFGTCRIRVDVVKDHVSPVLNVDTPELRLYDVEILHAHVGHVPKHEWHGPAWSCGSRSLLEAVSNV
jgi:hypothetical protein